MVARVLFKVKGKLTSHIILNDVRMSNLKGIFKLKGKVREVQLAPVRTSLLPNYPNPFNPETWIPFTLSEDAKVMIRIYDLSGRVVRRLILGRLNAGYYVDKKRAIRWDGRNDQGEQVGSGVYIIELNVNGKRYLRRAVVTE
ncbi:T9SS type A sorting domain-containing protein [Candidatus Poribacteria bacterium]|nr:T9SS type A sorting domain-containing protein [Candidatus Poribacteria bacterium]